jgi:hypothetical protein
MSKAIQRFIERLAALRQDNVFNPYGERCPLNDRQDAVAIRRRNLEVYLSATIENGIDTVWFGRDLGYRGGRRTGVALTDEAHLPVLAKLLGSKLIQQATEGEAVAERTATVVWGMVFEIKQLPFFWNTFPFHPFESGDPMSNRAHTRSELRKVWDLNLELLDILQPQKLVAIGNDAHQALSREGLECEYVRHPSYGGQADFVAGLRRIHGLDRGDHRSSAGYGQQSLAFA